MSPYGRRRDDILAAASSTYNRSRVLSSTPVDLVVLLYERLLADLKGGAIAIRAGDMEAKAERVSRATDVIFELMGALNREDGGEVGERLAALYSYMFSRVSEASRDLDADGLEEVANHVESLLSAWRTIAAQQKERASEAPATDSAPGP